MEIPGETFTAPHYPEKKPSLTLPGDEGVPGWQSAPRLIFREIPGETFTVPHYPEKKPQVLHYPETKASPGGNLHRA